MMKCSYVGEPFRVLVVDDNPAIHDDFSKILSPPDANHQKLKDLEAQLFDQEQSEDDQTARFEIDTASQGQKAIELVQRATDEQRPYSVAFVDVRMPPGIDGIKTIAEMWRLDPNIQAVICTAYSDHSWNDIIRSLGHSDGLLVLKKPFDAIEVLQVAHALGRKWLLGQQVKKQLGELDSLVQSRTRDLKKTNEQLREEVERRAEAEESLKHLATHDPLTGLPNRLLLSDRLANAVSRARRHDRTIALLLLDLDHFKDVNDSFGHTAGDELLTETASRLKACVRECDTVARMGGDEFVVLLEDLREPDEAGVVAQRIIKTCSRPFVVQGHQLRAPPSIGIAAFPTDCQDPECLLKSADLAMYQAKSTRRGSYHFYAQGLLATSLEKVELREQLERALAREEFTLWYQPLLDLRTGQIASMEALVRWQHPDLGMVPPIKFIPMAERTGLIVPLGRWVLRSACEQLARWRAAGARELAVAVNVSARQLKEPGFVQTIQEVLETTGLPPSSLELELTETAAMENVQQSTSTLKQILESGVGISIDDFGSGYSSLMRLKELSIHTLKIDRSFVKDITNDPRDAAIVKAIVAMAHSMDITVVAEGVETPDQLEFLRTMRWDLDSWAACDRAQGFLFSKPLPVEAATTLLRGEVNAEVAADVRAT